MIRHKWYTSLLAFSPLSETIIAAGFFLLCFAVFLPDLFFLIRSPMGGDAAALKDSSVSFAVFMPAFREFRYELLEHGNILWSSLRGMGLPILGNGVQGAPLFPLNLLLVWLPDQLYWSIMPISRVVLIALGMYLLARRVFGLSIVAGLVFAVLIGFNLNIIRWINHPWLNGILAGIWYLYFCCSVFASATAKRSTLGLHCTGLIVSVFAMVTCGFPEASALAAIFAGFSFIAFVATGWIKYQRSLSKRFILLALCHVVGFCLSAVQVFALIEFVDLGQTKELREHFIGAAFRAEQALPFALAQFTYFWMTEIQQKYINFYVGLFGALFFLRGLFLWPRVTNKPWIGISFLVMMALYVIKSFGLLPVVEIAFSKIPVLNQSHFPLYFSPLLYFGIAYFVALGVEGLFRQPATTKKQRLADLAMSVSATIGILLLAAFSMKYFNNFEWRGLIEKYNSSEITHLRFFVIGATLLNLYLVLNLSDKFMAKIKPRSGIFSLFAGVLIVVWLFIEVHNSLFRGFLKPDDWMLNLTRNYAKTLEQAVARAPVRKHELRGSDQNGDYVSHGIATINNGISAILPLDQRLLRTTLFYPEFGGYFPIRKSTRPWAWESTSSNLIVVNTTARGAEDWSRRQVDPEINPRGEDWADIISIARASLFIFKGSVHGYYKGVSDVRPWIHFKGKQHAFWVRGNIASQQNLGLTIDRYEILTDWRVRIPNEWLQEDSYQVTVRQTSGSNGGYADIPPIRLDLVPMQAESNQPYKFSEFPDMTNSTLLAAAPDESLHLFYNHNALPRAYVASGCQLSATHESTMQFLIDSDAVLQGEVLLEKNEFISPSLCESYSARLLRIPIETDRGSTLQLGTVTGPALVVLNDYTYPGWNAVDLISGREFKIMRANSLFRAVYLPEDREYKLRYFYKPWWLNIVYGLLVLAPLLVWLSWRWLGTKAADDDRSEFFA